MHLNLSHVEIDEFNSLRTVPTNTEVLLCGL